MIWYIENIIGMQGVTVSSPSSSTRAPLSNLYKSRLCEFTRLTSGDQYIQIDCPSSKQIDSVVIGGVNPVEYGGINFDEAVFQASNDNFSSILFESNIIREDREIHLFKMFDEPITAKSFRICTSGSGNKDIGRLFIGMKDKLPSMDPSQEITPNFTGSTVISGSGQSYSPGADDDDDEELNYIYLTIKFSLPRFNIPQMQRIMDILYKMRNVKPFFVKTWNKGKEIRMIYGKLEGDASPFGRTTSGQRPFKNEFTIREVF